MSTVERSRSGRTPRSRPVVPVESASSDAGSVVSELSAAQLTGIGGDDRAAKLELILEIKRLERLAQEHAGQK